MAGQQDEAQPRRAWHLRQLDRLADRLNRLYLLFNRTLRSYPAVLYRAILAFGKHDGPFVSAALAYYALLSLFPLLVFLITAASSFVSVQEAKRLVLEVVARYLPGSIEVASRTVEEILAARGTIGVVALLGLLWSASGVFGAIFRAVNRAWGDARPTPAWESRLMALAMTLVLGLLFLLNLAMSTLLSILQSWRLPVLGWQVFLDPGVSRLFGWLSALVMIAISAALFSVIYRTLPRAKISWREVWPGGIAAGVAWQIAKLLFTWYLGYARYNLLYGSIGAIVGVLLWSYLTALILLLGAEFTAQYSYWRRAGRPIDNRLPRELREDYA
jgi:YihY family inner membrane protein